MGYKGVYFLNCCQKNCLIHRSLLSFEKIMKAKDKFLGYIQMAKKCNSGKTEKPQAMVYLEGTLLSMIKLMMNGYKHVKCCT